jgi:hypothetical protein
MLLLLHCVVSIVVMCGVDVSIGGNVNIRCNGLNLDILNSLLFLLLIFMPMHSC